MSTPILLCFGYFVLLSVALVGVQTFLPSMLGALEQTPFDVANQILTGFLVGSSVGILAGGLLADRFPRHDFIVAGGLAAAALLFILVGTSPLPNLALRGSWSASLRRRATCWCVAQRQRALRGKCSVSSIPVSMPARRSHRSASVICSTTTCRPWSFG
jgi:MFS family permease